MVLQGSKQLLNLPPPQVARNWTYSTPAASSAHRRLPFSSIGNLGSWSPVGIHRPHRRQAAFLPTPSSPSTPVSSATRRSAACSITTLPPKHLQPPPRQAGDPLKLISSTVFTIKTIKNQLKYPLPPLLRRVACSAARCLPFHWHRTSRESLCSWLRLHTVLRPSSSVC